MNSLKREKTPWTKFRKKHRPKKKENGEDLFDESRRKELENKAYPSKFMAATMFFPFNVFPEAFLVILLQIQWAIFVAGAREVRSSSFIGWRSVPVDSRFDEV